MASIARRSCRLRTKYRRAGAALHALGVCECKAEDWRLPTRCWDVQRTSAAALPASEVIAAKAAGHHNRCMVRGLGKRRRASAKQCASKETRGLRSNCTRLKGLRAQFGRGCDWRASEAGGQPGGSCTYCTAVQQHPAKMTTVCCAEILPDTARITSASTSSAHLQAQAARRAQIGNDTVIDGAVQW
jgi:hypothetical protein